MKKLTPILFISLLSCSTPPTGRSPASLGGLQKDMQGAQRRYQLQILKDTHQICGMSFDQIHITSDGPLFFTQKSITHPKLPYSYSLPHDLEILGTRTPEISLEIDQSDITFQNPLLPQIPILNMDSEQKYDCSLLKIYHKHFFSTLTKSRPFMNLFEMRDRFTFGIKSPEVIESRINLKRQEQEQLRLQNSQLQSQTKNRYQEVDSLFFYSPLYKSDVEQLAHEYRKLGYKPQMISLSELPGIRENDPVPQECLGEYFEECYYSPGRNRPLDGTSKEMIMSLKGYQGSDGPSFQFSKIPYIPGLIRAYIRRHMLSGHVLKGVTLVGATDDMPGYHLLRPGHYERKYPHQHRGTLHTDIFYMMPFVVVIPQTIHHHVKLNPDLITCKNGDKTRLGYWCVNNEWKYFPPNEALRAIKWANYVPMARIFSPKSSLNGSMTYTDWNSLRIDQMVPVGRIPTQEKVLGKKDDIVSNYVQKVKKWHASIPEIKNNSIASFGGEPIDAALFTPEDIALFKSAYGRHSKIYASEFFVPLPRCEGKCEYKSGEEILELMKGKNYTSMLINGHGAHRGIQAPYAIGGENGISSSYTTEKYWHINNDSARLEKISKSTHNSFGKLENETIIGHVLANSCDTSNFNLDNGFHYLMSQADPNAQQRSLAENLLQIKNGGALNVFMNSDVGLGGSDNAWNVLIMSEIIKSHESCKNIGSTYMQTIFNELKKNNHYLDWQLSNRQYLGSPLNFIAKPHPSCIKLGPSVPSQGFDQ